MLKKSIHFFCESIAFKVPNTRRLRQWIKEIFIEESTSFQTLNYVFCSDIYLHAMNVQYLGHNTLTDIITFDTSENDQEISGDIFISIERVRENAVINSETFVDELHRVIAHGALHLIGYNDKTTKQRLIMRQKENHYIAMFPVEH